MSLWMIAWRYVVSRGLVTALTVTGVMLGVALISSVLTLERETEDAFLEEGALFDLVAGGKGSPLQLVLSAVYHLDSPTGNIPWERYQALKEDPRVTSAVPIGLGDNYQDIRIVGTSAAMFDLERRVPGESRREPVFPGVEGRIFEEPFEVVLGAQAARKTGLAIGDQFVGVHGLMMVPGAEEHSDFPYIVTGIMEPSGTALDRVIYTPIESVWIVHEAEEQLHEEMFGSRSDQQEEPPAPEEESEEEEVDSNWGFLAGFADDRKTEPEATAVLLQLKTPGMRLWMADEINRETEAMAAIPVNELLRLYQRVIAPMQQALVAVAYLVVAVACLTILTTLYQAAERRRRDLAMMRALGARPWEIFTVVLLEALLLTLMGLSLGWLAGHGAVAYAARWLEESAALTIDPWSTAPEEWRALAIVAVAGLTAGVIPAAMAYLRPPQTDLGRGN